MALVQRDDDADGEEDAVQDYGADAQPAERVGDGCMAPVSTGRPRAVDAILPKRRYVKRIDVLMQKMLA